MNERELRRELRDIRMRRALLRLLQEATRTKYSDFVEPMRDDDQVTEELHRILKVRKGWLR